MGKRYILKWTSCFSLYVKLLTKVPARIQGTIMFCVLFFLRRTLCKVCEWKSYNSVYKSINLYKIVFNYYTVKVNLFVGTNFHVFFLQNALICVSLNSLFEIVTNEWKSCILWILNFRGFTEPWNPQKLAPHI